MKVEFDPAKDEENRRKHGLSLDHFDGFDSEPAVLPDERQDYGEIRFRVFGRIDGRGHCLAFTMRDEMMRLIGFRRAHEREMRRYERE